MTSYNIISNYNDTFHKLYLSFTIIKVVKILNIADCYL